MRDIISAIIGEDHFLRCSTYSIARNGEGLTPCLSISIPEGLCDYWAYIDFRKPNGETFKTPRIDGVDGRLVYNMPCSVLDVEGQLEVQAVFQNADGEIWKTYVKEFAVRQSINAVDDIPDKQDFITEAQKLLDEIENAGGGSVDLPDGEEGQVLTKTPDGYEWADPVELESANIDEDGFLCLRDSKGETFTVGKVVGEPGTKGDPFTYEDFTPEQLETLKGKDGKDGIDGKDGKDGANGKDGVNGVDGKDGVNGKDGVSATHSWDGTVLTITSASGSSSADLKGGKGDKGDSYILTDTDKQDIASMVKVDIGALENNTAGTHNSIFRGKNLGNTVTAEQWKAIEDGTFNDLWIGDYWEINGVKWRIAGFDYFFRDYYTASDNKASANHHITIVPDTCPDGTYYVMNTDGSTTRGYGGCEGRLYNMATTKTKIGDAFGTTHIMPYVAPICNMATDGAPNSLVTMVVEIELLSEVMVFGRHIVASADEQGSYFNTGTSGMTQLPLFALAPDFTQGLEIYREQNLLGYWLRDIATNGCFACVTTSSGLVGRAGAGNKYGAFRPVFSIYNPKTTS